MNKGMTGHQSTRMIKDEWLTPPEIVGSLGPFDLDPCAPIVRPWDLADKQYTIEDNGLIQKWEGRVGLNPPYGKHTVNWLKKLADHGNGIALIFARTETRAFFEQVWDRADALLFIRGRISFYHRSGDIAGNNGGAPSVLIAYGSVNVEYPRTCEVPGKFIELAL